MGSHFSLSPASSISSLSSECDSESCASLNSVNTPIIRSLHSTEMIISPLNISSDFTLKLPSPTTRKRKRKKQKHKTQKLPKSRNKTRRNSKDCSDITIMSRLTAKPLQEWTVREVIQWIKYIEHGKFKECAHKFQSKKIDGKKLNRL